MDTIMPLCTSLLKHMKQSQMCYQEAIHFAKQKDFNASKKKMKEGSYIFIKGQRIHNDIVKQYTASNEKLSLLLVHCEDCLMATATLKILAEECIDVYHVML